MREEWAEEAADIVWRRSKLGLRLSRDQVAALETFMAEQSRPVRRRLISGRPARRFEFRRLKR